jgi:hypothetical protein
VFVLYQVTAPVTSGLPPPQPVFTGSLTGSAAAIGVGTAWTRQQADRSHAGDTGKPVKARDLHGEAL